MTIVSLAEKMKTKSTIATSIKAKNVIRAIILSFKEALVDGESITIVGFGSFKVIRRAGHKGRNLKTGAEVLIPAHNTVKFTSSGSFNKAILK